MTGEPSDEALIEAYTTAYDARATVKSTELSADRYRAACLAGIRAAIAAGVAPTVREAAALLLDALDAMGDRHPQELAEHWDGLFEARVGLRAALAVEGVVPEQGGEGEAIDPSNSTSGHLGVQRDDGAK